MPVLKSLAVVGAALTLTASLHAQTTVWTNGGNNSEWSDPANWSAGVPNASSLVQIGTQPTDNIVGLETGLITNVIAGFTFNDTLTASISVLAAGVENLTVAGAINNSSNFAHSFELPVFAAANATYHAGQGLTFNSLIVGTNTIGVTGSLTVTDTLVLDLTSAASYGTIGSIDVTGATINIGGLYTGNVGDTFDLTTGSFAGATIGVLPTLSEGLSWDTSQFLSQGILTVVPEPAVLALLSLGTAAIIFGKRRRRG